MVNTVENPFYNDEATTQTQASTSSLFNVYSHTQEEEEMVLEDEEVTFGFYVSKLISTRTSWRPKTEHRSTPVRGIFFFSQVDCG